MHPRRALALVGVVLSLAYLNGCRLERDAGPAVRIRVGARDTLIVNAHTATVPTHAFGVSGAEVPPTGVRYTRLAGDSLDLTSEGVVTCLRRGDATYRATIGSATTRFVVHCRPVATLRIAGPIQFTVGDTSQDLQVQALDASGTEVDLLAGSVTSQRADVVSVEQGLRVRPLRAGVSLISMRAGDVGARVGAHVYEPVHSFDNLRPDQRLVRMSLRLESGEVRRWRIPAGQWMLTMMPYESATSGLRLRVEGAICMKDGLSPRRIVCEAKTTVTILVYHPSTVAAPAMTGDLLIRRINS